MDSVITVGRRDTFLAKYALITTGIPMRKYLTLIEPNLSIPLSDKRVSSLLMWMLVWWQMFGHQSLSLTYFFLPFYAADLGMNSDEITIIIAVLAIVELIGQLVFSCLSNANKAFNPTFVVTLSLLWQGICFQLVALYSNFWSLILFCLARGLQGGAFMGLTPAIIVHFVGRDEFRRTFSFMALLRGVALAVGYIVMGALRTSSGNFYSPFYYLGATNLVSAALLAIMPLIRRIQKKQNLDKKAQLAKFKATVLGKNLPQNSRKLPKFANKTQTSTLAKPDAKPPAAVIDVGPTKSGSGRLSQPGKESTAQPVLHSPLKDATEPGSEVRPEGLDGPLTPGNRPKQNRIN